MARTRRNRTTHKLGRSTWRQYGFAEFKGLMYLVLAAAYSSLSLFNLSPVYGSIPSSLYHTQAWTSVLLLAIATAVFARQRLPQSFASWLPVIAFWIPTIQSVLFNYSSRFGPVFGPLITEALTVLPLLLLSTFAAWDAFSGVAVRTPRAADTMRGIAAFAVMAVGKKSFASLVRSLTGFFPFVMSSGLQILLASLYTFLAPSRLLWLAIPSLLHSLLFNVHMPFPQTTSLLNQKLFSQSSYTVLARRESVTGYLSVLESQKDHLRVMRCDHSLLGGVWLMSQDTQQPPRKVEEPIYSVFALLEAVRLVEIDEPMRLHGRSISEDSSKEALMMYVIPSNLSSGQRLTCSGRGLGVGTPAAALIAHGVNTTIVEIDPVVHDYATIYFGLPLNHVSVIEDAVTFVERAGRKQSSYDFIIHDVFTGGAEPISLFTVEFIRGLRRLLKPNGVVAIVSPLTRVLFVLESFFDYRPALDLKSFPVLLRLLCMLHSLYPPRYWDT